MNPNFWQRQSGKLSFWPSLTVGQQVGDLKCFIYLQRESVIISGLLWHWLWQKIVGTSRVVSNLRQWIQIKTIKIGVELRCGFSCDGILLYINKQPQLILTSQSSHSTWITYVLEMHLVTDDWWTYFYGIKADPPPHTFHLFYTKCILVLKLFTHHIPYWTVKALFSVGSGGFIF